MKIAFMMDLSKEHGSVCDVVVNRDMLSDNAEGEIFHFTLTPALHLTNH